MPLFFVYDCFFRWIQRALSTQEWSFVTAFAAAEHADGAHAFPGIDIFKIAKPRPGSTSADEETTSFSVAVVPQHWWYEGYSRAYLDTFGWTASKLVGIDEFRKDVDALNQMWHSAGFEVLYEKRSVDTSRASLPNLAAHTMSS